MTFPDGRVKDGFFENNVFKGNLQVTNDPLQSPSND
jgi:hypothetical protein